MRFRLFEYARLISHLGKWPVLFILWGRFFEIFLQNMVARASHLSAAGMHVTDLPCAAPECDFSSFWPAGLLALQGHVAAVYDPAAMLALRARVFFAGIETLNWCYPPTALLALAPIARLPFETAFVAWTAMGVVAAVILLRYAGLSWRVVLLALVSPAALWNFEQGQVGLILAASMVAGLRLVPGPAYHRWRAAWYALGEAASRTSGPRHFVGPDGC